MHLYCHFCYLWFISPLKSKPQSSLSYLIYFWNYSKLPFTCSFFITSSLVYLSIIISATQICCYISLFTGKNLIPYNWHNNFRNMTYWFMIWLHNKNHLIVKINWTYINKKKMWNTLYNIYIVLFKLHIIFYNYVIIIIILIWIQLIICSQQKFK